MLVVSVVYALGNGDVIKNMWEKGRDAVTPDQVSIEMPADAMPLVDTLKNEVASQYGVDASEVRVVEAEMTFWTERNIIKKGYRVVIEVAGKQLEYRVDKDGGYTLQHQ
jgi:hypothetical protein